MPAVIDNPSRGFDLSDFTSIPNPPKDDGPPDPAPVLEKPADTAPAPAAPDATIHEPEIKPLAEPPPDESEPSSSRTLGDALSEHPEKPAPAADTPKPPVADAKPKDAAPPPAPSAAEQRDADLKVEHGQHVHPNTRKRFDEVRSKVSAARDERDAATRRAEEAEARAKAAEERAAKVVPAVPKETEEEIKTLRERVRELDITKDPVIEQKYDRRIAANNDGIIAALKNEGLGTGNDPVTGKPADLPGLMKAGLTLNNLHPYLTLLEKAGRIEEADAIRESVRENNRLARERGAEIEGWKADYGKRQQERTTIAKQQQDGQSQAFRQHTETVLKTDLEALAKDFSYINQPPAPLPTDAPATVQAKNAALAEWNAASKSIEEAVKAFDPAGQPPEKVPEIVGRLNAAAIQAVMLKGHVLPRVRKELAAKTARIAELEGEVARFKDAGKISRLHGSAPTPNSENRSGSTSQSIEQALLAHRPD